MIYENFTIDPNIFNPALRMAVNCETEEEAKALVRYCTLHFPEKCDYWSEDRTCWSNYEEDTCYTIFQGVTSSLSWGDRDWFIDRNYAVYRFKDIFIKDEELEESDLPIEFLIGGQ